MKKPQRVRRSSRGSKRDRSNLPRAVIFTALSLEFNAVCAHLADLRQEAHEQGSVYERGLFHNSKSSWDVIVAETGMGNISSAIEVERAINLYQPVVALFVGIAGGIKDVKIGDVVVAPKVYGYESGAAKEIFLTRPDVSASSYMLEQRAKFEARRSDWLKRIIGLGSRATPRAFVGPIASGEKVIKSTQSSVYNLIRSRYNDVLAVDMEAHGFLRAARANEVNAIVIRGISDLIEDKKRSDAAGSQEIAAAHASAFAFQLLANLVPIIQKIGSSLNLMRDFQEKTLEVLNKKSSTPAVQAEQVDDALQISEQGVAKRTLEEKDLKLNEWDETRVRSLKKRVSSNWGMYNDYYAELPLQSVDERIRLKYRMNQIKDELCTDFQEMIRIFERTLAIDLDEYRSLYEICGMSIN